MKIKNIFLIGLLLVGGLASCNDDDDAPQMDNFGGQGYRVKKIAGNNKVWGDYHLTFEYKADGRLKSATRCGDAAAKDTLGFFSVGYDIDEQDFRIYDYVLGIDQDSIDILKKEFPQTYQDTLKRRKMSQMLYSVKKTKNRCEQKINRPRRNVGNGDNFNPSYLHVSKELQRLETIEGTKKPAVIRTNHEVFGDGGENSIADLSVYKYEFTYDGNNIVSGAKWLPDSNSDISWSKNYDINFQTFSGVTVSIDCDQYKMRRSGNKVVVAEPGRKITYTLNERGLAVKFETSDGETATIEYEEGNGNFSELYAMPLDEALGKVWIR